ncbi:MAG: DUF6249 domain-containing protein [Bacteroidaceae bacterium]|nr:DUF6249 domain-containing protein [Bacteroidaceae bacterium]
MLALPIIATLLAFLVPIVILGIILIYFHKKRKATNELLMKALEAGVPLPKEYIKKEENEEKIDKSLLARGIKLTGIGVGLTGLLWGLVDESIAWTGFLIICVGLSQIVVYFSCRPTNEEKTSTTPVNPTEKETTTTKEQPKTDAGCSVPNNTKSDNWITDIEIIDEETPNRNS